MRRIFAATLSLLILTSSFSYKAFADDNVAAIEKISNAIDVDQRIDLYLQFQPENDYQLGIAASKTIRFSSNAAYWDTVVNRLTGLSLSDKLQTDPQFKKKVGLLALTGAELLNGLSLDTEFRMGQIFHRVFLGVFAGGLLGFFPGHFNWGPELFQHIFYAASLSLGFSAGVARALYKINTRKTWPDQNRSAILYVAQRCEVVITSL